MKKIPACTAILALCASLLNPLYAVDETWDGDTDGAWADITNWVGDFGSPGAGDIATFDSAGGAIDTIDLGGAVTIDQIIVDATGGTAYTFGVGADTLTFSDNANDPNFSLTGAADADQTINAGLWLGTDASIGDINFDLDSTTQTLIINGNIDTLSGGTPGVKRLEFGDFDLADMGSVELNGDILNSGGATRIDLFIAGADLTMSGNVDGTSNTQRTYIRFGNTVTVNPGGSLGQGTMSIRHGDLVLNTDLQEFFNGLNFGEPTQGNGPATATIGAANTVLQNSGITYFADNNIANVATLQGGIVQITGADRAIIVNDNTLIDPASPELSITSTLTNDGTNRGLTVRNTNGGTLLIAPSGAGNSHGGVVTVQEGTLQLGNDALSTGGAGLAVSARNHAATADGVSATVDLRGSLNTVNNITIGTTNTGSIPGTNGFMGSIVDSVGGGLLDDANNITYNAGSSGKENGAALLAADVEFDASGTFKNVTIRDGSADTDLTITGELSTIDPLHVLSFNGEGTLGFEGTLSLHDRAMFQNRKTVLGPGASVQGDRETYVRQRNNADASDFEVELDLNGQELVLTDDLFISQNNTTAVAAIASTRITDSAGGGKIRLTGDNDIRYEAGAPTPNVTAFIETDLQFEGSNFTFATNDGASDVDVNVSGVITDDSGGGWNLTKTGAGTLLLSNPANAYNLLQINNGRVIITDVGALGDNDIHVGNNTTDGIVEFQLAADAAVLNANQVRIGDDNAAAGRIGTASVVSNGAGAVTFPNANFFNELRNNATEDRTLTLGGSNAGDNTIAGVIRDNGAGGSVVSVDKTGAGKWILQGINTYTGGTNVLEGRLDIDGSVGGTLTVANGASIGGDGTIASTVTLGMTSLFFDGSTAEALTAQGPIDTSAGVTVFVTANGAGALTVLNYNPGATNNISTTHFTLDGSVVTSGRGAGPFADTGSAITIDLGYGNKTWTSFTSSQWVEGATGDNNWTFGGTSDELYYDGDYITFDDTHGFNDVVTLVDNVVPASLTFNNDTFTVDIDTTTRTITSETDIVVSGNANVGIGAVIAGTSGLTKGDGNDGTADGGILLLSAANTYSGGTLIEEGIVQVTNNLALGSGDVTLSDAGAANNTDPVLDIDASGMNVANDILISNAGNNKSLRFDVAGAGNAAEISGDITIDEAGTFLNFDVIAGGGETLTLSGLISGVGGINKLGGGTGTVVLANGANSFAGDLRTSSGTLEVASIADAGLASHAGAGSILYIGLNQNSGTLRYTGSGGSTNRQVQVGDRTFGAGERTGAGTLANDGSGGLLFTNVAFNVADIDTSATIGPRTLTLGGSYTGSNEIQGVIVDNAASDLFVNETVGIEVDTAGTWVLSGPGNYSGTTTVTAGTLLINGDHSGASGPVLVAAGATLGGTGTIGSAADIDGTVAPGLSIGTLTASDTVLDGTLAIEVVGTSTDLFEAEALTLTGTSVLDIIEGGTGATEAAYVIATYTSLTGTFGTENLPAGYVVDYNYLSGNQIALVQGVVDPDTDGDGIPDAWEIANFGDLTTADETTDFDDDGALDINEYAFDTDPTDIASRFTVTVVYNCSTDTAVDIVYGPVKATRTYAVEASETGMGFAVLPGSTFTPGADAATNTFTDITPADVELYRISVSVN